MKASIKREAAQLADETGCPVLTDGNEFFVVEKRNPGTLRGYGTKRMKMEQDYGGFLVSIPYDLKLIERIKMMDGKWNPRLKMWFVPQIWEGELIDMTKGHITKRRTITEIEAEQKRGYNINPEILTDDEQRVHMYKMRKPLTMTRAKLMEKAGLADKYDREQTNLALELHKRGSKSDSGGHRWNSEISQIRTKYGKATDNPKRGTPKYHVCLKPTVKGYLPIEDNIITNDTLESEIKRRYKGIYELDYILPTQNPEIIVRESFPTRHAANLKKSELEFSGALIKEDILLDNTDPKHPKYIIEYIPEDKEQYEGFKPMTLTVSKPAKRGIGGIK